MFYEGILSLVKMEIEAIENEGAADRALLKLRMDAIYVNLGNVRRSGYRSAKEKDQYGILLAEFTRLQEQHRMCYDGVWSPDNRSGKDSSA